MAMLGKSISISRLDIDIVFKYYSGSEILQILT